MPLRAEGCECSHVPDYRIVGMYRHVLQSLSGLAGVNGACVLVAITVVSAVLHRLEREARSELPSSSVDEAIEIGKQLVQIADDTDGRVMN